MPDSAFIIELFPTFMVELLRERKVVKAGTYVRRTNNCDNEVLPLLFRPFTKEPESRSNSERFLKCFRPVSRRREYQGRV